MNIEKEIMERGESINLLLESYLPEETGYQKRIFEAVNYSMLAGGKRLRPMLMQETYRLFEGKSQAIMSFMAAIEMIHTYSLVHDDLPAMDNDEFRRGKRTTHAVYGEAMGILAGDALLNFAYETAAGAFEIATDSPAVGKALMVLAKKAGVYGMVGGQVVDVEGEKKLENVEMTRERLDFIYRLKTGALIEASMMIGAILADASAEDVTKMEQIAAKIGLAFQIQDDILDVVGNEEELGKPIGSDEKNNKVTYVTFEGLEKAKKDVARLSQEAVQLLDSIDADTEFLKELIQYLIHRTK